jgi:glycopeptide antibiotics resistance protein
VTRRTPLVAFVAVYSIAYVVAGLFPFDFDFGRTLYLYPTGDWADIVANIAAFVPFGLAFAAAPLTRHPRISATVYCTLLSLCIEGLQTFVPQRFTQISDVICNGTGAWIGAWFCACLRLHIPSNGVVPAQSHD